MKKIIGVVLLVVAAAMVPTLMAVMDVDESHNVSFLRILGFTFYGWKALAVAIGIVAVPAILGLWLLLRRGRHPAADGYR